MPNVQYSPLRETLQSRAILNFIFLVVIEDLLTRDWLVTSWISDCLNSRMFADLAKVWQLTSAQKVLQF